MRCSIAEEAGVRAEAATRRKAKAEQIKLGWTEGSGAQIGRASCRERVSR